MATLVKFKDTTDDSDDINFGILHSWCQKLF